MTAEELRDKVISSMEKELKADAPDYYMLEEIRAWHSGRGEIVATVLRALRLGPLIDKHTL